ncbi:MAG: Tfp pilus assembly protein FimT/FimU [Planctomycetota bacterium]
MRSRRRVRGFTLIELLVVVGIICIATAMAMPAINQFLKGQKLTQAGRMIQSAFNESRRAAITQRSRHWIFFGRVSGGGSASPDSYALAHYREGKGWDSTQIIKLPSSIEPVFEPTDENDPSRFTKPLRGCRLIVQDWTDGLPANTSPTGGHAQAIFMEQTTLTPLTNCSTFEFRKDGTIIPKNAVDISPAMAPGNTTDIYDVNAVFDSLAKTTPADMILRQIGEPSRRCFVDVDVNTGRVRFRVAETTDSTGTTSGP